MDNGRLSPHPVCESTKFIEDLLSVGEEDDRRWDDIAEDYEIPAAEARNRGGENNGLDAARLEELANFLRSGQVIRIEARRQNGCGVCMQLSQSHVSGDLYRYHVRDSWIAHYPSAAAPGETIHTRGGLSERISSSTEP